MAGFDIILAGCGTISEQWFDYIVKRDDCRFVAIVDKNLEAAKKAIETYSLDCPAYTSVEEAFEKEKGNLFIDLTYVTVHHDVVTLALKKGYDVLGEKPMAFTVEQVNSMLKAVEESGKRYIIMQNRRYIDQVQKLRALIQSGKLGDPVYVCGDIFVAADMKSIRNSLKYPQLQDNNIHAFDQARYLVKGKPVSVYYHSFNPKGSKYVGDAACSATFEFEDGCVFNFRGYNGAEGCHTTWDHDWRIVCEKGTALWPGKDDVRIEYTDEPGTYIYHEDTIKRPEIALNQHGTALADMFDALITGRTAQTECWDNVYSIGMVLASVKSAEEGRKIGIRVNENYPYLQLI